MESGYRSGRFEGPRFSPLSWFCPMKIDRTTGLTLKAVYKLVKADTEYDQPQIDLASVDLTRECHCTVLPSLPLRCAASVCDPGCTCRPQSVLELKIAQTCFVP